MKNSLILFFTLVLTISLNAQTIDDQFFAKVDRFFKENVTDGRVDYVGIKEGNSLKPLMFEISQADVSKSDDKTKQAFLINAYNLHVIKKIVDSYPIQSVAENSGFFSKDKIVVAKVMMTLNQLENERLIGKYHDPRYHFVLVCGCLLYTSDAADE